MSIDKPNFRRPEKITDIIRDSTNNTDSSVEIKNEAVKSVIDKLGVKINKENITIIDDVYSELENTTGIGLSDNEISNLMTLTSKQIYDYMYTRLLVHESCAEGTKLNELVKDADILDNLDNPLEMSSDDISSIIGRDARKKAMDKHKKAMEAIYKYINTVITNRYVESRKKLDYDGIKIDRTLNAMEIQNLAANTSVIVDCIVKAHPGLQGDRISGSAETFNEMNSDFRYRYDSFKEIVCNDYGITPESFDEWYKAVAKDTESRLSDGINIRTELYDTKESQMKHKHLLKRVEGWKKGDIVWRSDFIKNVDEYERKELAKSAKHVSKDSMELFEGMRHAWRSLDNPAKAEKKGIGTEESRNNFIKRRRNKRLSESVPKDSRIEISEEPDNDEKQDSPSPELDLWKLVEGDSFSESPTINPVNDDVTSSNKEEHADSDNIIKGPIPFGEIDEVVAEIQKESTPKVEHKPKTDDYFVNRYENSDEFDLDSIIPTKKFEADISKLRISDPVQRLVAYRESKREGRLLYLINSGYEVFVKKIKLRDKISYMLQLIQQSDATDINLVDAAFKTEILRVIYESIEFNFETQPSFDEFIQNLHEDDLLTLITMIALVNTPENKDGRVPLNVSSVICSNCGKPSYFKEPITLDLKEEFKNMYPVEIYATEYSKYKMAGFKDITSAYRASNVGNMSVIKGSDDDVTFEILISLPTVWKTQQLRVNRDSMMYQSVKNEYLNRFESIKTLRPDLNLEPIRNYLENNSFMDFRKSMGDIYQLDEDDSELEENKSIARVLSMIESEMEAMSEVDSAFMYLMELIDSVNVKINGGDYLIKNLTLSTPYKLLEIVKGLPMGVIEDLTSYRIKEVKRVTPIDITYEPEELLGRFDFDAFYGDDKTAEESKRKQLIGMGYEGDELDDIVHDYLVYRSEVRDKCNNDAVCPNCKKAMTYKVNYTNILFFWTSKVLQ